MTDAVKQAGPAQAASILGADRQSRRQNPDDTSFGDALQPDKALNRKADPKEAAPADRPRWNQVNARLAATMAAGGPAWATDDKSPARPRLQADTGASKIKSEKDILPANEAKVHEDTTASENVTIELLFGNVIQTRQSFGATAGGDAETGDGTEAEPSDALLQDTPTNRKSAFPGAGKNAAATGMGTEAALGSNMPAEPVADPGLRQNASGRTAGLSAQSAARTQAQEPDAPRSPQASGNSRVNVLGTQNIPAPPTPAPSPTTTAFIETLATDTAWRAAAQEAAMSDALGGRGQPGGVQSLKIQLHPAELGVVTASLRFAGEQLSVDLKVESAEAYHRLNSDADTIAKALRSLGYEIDQITIQQPQPANQTNTRSDGSAGNPGNFARDQQPSLSSNSGGGDRLGGGNAGGERDDDAQNADGGRLSSQGVASRGLYI